MNGVVDGMPDAEYHGRRESLSVSGAKLLLPPSCPALYRWTMDNGRPPKRAFDYGHAAHKMVLGVGPTIAVIEADDWRTKAAREARDEAYANGEVPMLTGDMEPLKGMVAAIRAHPVASRLLAPGSGKAEQSLFWVDDDTGIDMRARLDWLPDPRSGRMVCPDYKTSRSANPEVFAKSAADFGYHRQDVHYRAGIRANNLDPDPAFVFVVQELTPPYLVSVVELDETAKRIGEEQMAKAARLFKHCTETAHWPGYSNDVELVGLPVYYQRQHGESAA